MGDHNHQNHHHHYGSLDLRQFINGRPTSTPPFAAIPNHPQPLLEEAFTLHRTNLPPAHQSHPHFDMMMLMPPTATSGLHKFRSDCSTSTTTTSAAAAVNPTAAGLGSGSGLVSGLDVEGSCFGCDGGTGRWPRQETLTLLEIRSRLDYKFKEANQKGPLWDEVSRIMSEEHGYQRSGKKCREKFENLYKYYKKTKEGKAGRQDGKHYRFFRQLDALCGDQTSSSNQQQQQLVSPAAAPRFLDHTRGDGFMFQDQEQAGTFQIQSQDQTPRDSLSLSSDFSSSSSGANVDGTNACEFDNDTTEKRRKRSGKSWKRKIKEFINSKMRKLMERQEAWLEKITKTLEEKEKERVLREEEWRKQESERMERAQKFWAKERAWIEARDAALMESLQNFTSRDHHHSLQNRVIHEAQTENCSETVINKKPSSSSYFQSCNESVYNPGEAYNCNQQEQEATASNVNAPPPPPPNDSYFRFLISDGENLWENYGLKLNRGDHS